jgi:release factor glutamine methyltransferase
VLVPRPETETLIEEALRDLPDENAAPAVLDLGTGSGCLLLSFLFERPMAIGLGCDASIDALRWAETNGQALGLSSRVDWLHGFWTEGVSDTFDIIFVNPPYIRDQDIAGLAPDVAQYEPRGALAGGADGLDAYRQVAPLLARHLAAAGTAYLEIGAAQVDSVGAILRAASLSVLRVVPDLAQIPRCIVVAHSRAEMDKKAVGMTPGNE